jgi:hypothetical protein
MSAAFQLQFIVIQQLEREATRLRIDWQATNLYQNGKDSYSVRGHEQEKPL